MAAVARYLADKSALARLHHPQVAAVLAPLIEAGLVATCPMIELGMLWSTRSAQEFAEVRADRGLGYESLPIEDVDWRRAIDVMAELWSSGRPRSVPLPDLLIAATAERHQVSVLHYDADFDVIASITAQPVDWVVAAGTVP